MRTPSPRRSDVVAHLVVLALAAVAVHRGLTADFGYNVFTDRDLLRGWRLWTDGLATGAEFSNTATARVPGSAVGLHFGLPQLLGGRARAVFASALILHAAAMLALHAALVPRLGAWTSALAVALAATHASLIGAQADLWNPSFVPAYAMGSTAAIVRLADTGQARWITLWAVLVAVGAQLHASLYAWGLATLPAIAWCGRGQLLRALPATLGALALVYAPYVVSEILTGFANTRAMASLPAVRDAGASTHLLGDTVRLLAQSPPAAEVVLPPWLRSLTSWSYAGTVALALASPLLAWPLRGPHRALAVGLGASVALTVAQYATSSLPYMAPRYLIVLGPPVGVSVAALIGGWSCRLPRVPAVLLACALGALLLPRATLLPGPNEATDPYGFLALDRTLREAQAHTGWTRQELAARSQWILAHHIGTPPERAAWPSVSHLLARDGEIAPWAGEAPCALFVAGSPESIRDDTLRDTDQLAAWLGRAQPDLTVDEVVSLRGSPWRLVIYTPTQGHCSSSMSQRYVDTAVEAALRTHIDTLDCGAHLPLPRSNPTRAMAAINRPTREPGRCDPFFVAVDLALTDEDLTVGLHSNQLRGITDNDAWLDEAVIDHPSLRLTRDEQVIVVPIEPGPVGGWFVLAPVSTTAPRPPAGTWTVDLVGELWVVEAERPAEPILRMPLEQRLADAWAVPPLSRP